MEIKIVESISKYNRELNEKIKKGGLEKLVLVMTPEMFTKVFSPERIKLLQRIHLNKIRSIYQLARELNKPYEVVFRNIKYLAGIGLIKIVSKDHKKIPHMTCKLLSVDLFSEVIVA